jgi:hypothetical protein
MVHWLNTTAGLRALSLLVALLLWLVVYLDGTSERELSVPVRPANLPTGLMLTALPLAPLDVSLTGPRAQLLFLSGDRIPLQLDLRGAGEGMVTFTNLGEQLHLPEQVRITRIFPTTLTLKLSRQPGRP